MSRSENHIRSIVEGVVQDQVMPLFQSSSESPMEFDDLANKMAACCTLMQNKLDHLANRMEQLTSPKDDDNEDKQKEKEILKEFLENYLKEDFVNTTDTTLRDVIEKVITAGGNAVLDIAGLATDLIKAIFYATQFWEVKHRLSEIERDLRQMKQEHQTCCNEMHQALDRVLENDEDIIHSLSNMHENMEQCCSSMTSGLEILRSNIAELRGLL